MPEEKPGSLGFKRSLRKWRGPIAAVVFVVLLVYVLGFERGPVSKPGENPTVGELINVRPGDVVGASFGSGGKNIEVSRQGDWWRIVRPISARCDRYEAERVTSGLVDQRVDGVLGEVEKLSEYGLDKPCFRVVLKTRFGAKALLFGDKDPSGTSVYVKPEDLSTVFLLPTYTVEDLQKKKPQEMRDKAVVDTSVDKIRSVVIESRGSRLEVCKRGDEWVISRPLSRDADEGAVDDLLFKLTGLRAEGFADSSRPLSEYGLDEPRLKVTVAVSGRREPLGVVLGKQSPKGIYAKRLDDNEVLLLKGDTLKELEKRPIDLMDKTIQPAKAEEITGLSITGSYGAIVLERRGSEWRMLKPKSAPADRNKVDSELLWDLGEMKAAKILSDRLLHPKQWGLDKPWLWIEVRSGKTSRTILFGQKRGDEVPVMVRGDSMVYAVSSWVADRLNVKPDDLLKK
ncbi:MAG: DUF4340 domain-containing protein [Armatimonadota bacterium]